MGYLSLAEIQHSFPRADMTHGQRLALYGAVLQHEFGVTPAELPGGPEAISRFFQGFMERDPFFQAPEDRGGFALKALINATRILGRLGRSEEHVSCGPDRQFVGVRQPPTPATYKAFLTFNLDPENLTGRFRAVQYGHFVSGYMWLDLTHLPLMGFDFSSADLFHVNLFRADLTAANLRGAGLAHGFFRDAVMDRAILEEADLTRADFSGASLRNARLRGARVERTELGTAVTDGADMSGIDMDRVTTQNLTPAEGREKVAREAREREARATWRGGAGGRMIGAPARGFGFHRSLDTAVVASVMSSSVFLTVGLPMPAGLPLVAM